MAFNGSGTFNRIYSWVTDAANGLFVSSTRMDTDTDDIAAGLTNCICKDGQSTPTANIPMGGFKITSLGLGSAATDAATVANANAYSICEFRLTLSTGVPVTTSDVTAATTLYASPYKGNRIALYDGTNWHMRNSTEFSIAVPATTSTMYDVFCYDSSGTPTLEVLAWTNDTTRATALVLQDGVLSKSGATTRRYLGSFRTTTVSGQTEDSIAKRYVWNYYNRVARQMQRVDSTTSWTYTTSTIRPANGSTANQLDFVMGYSEDVVRAEVIGSASNTSAGATIAIGIGLDTTTTFTGKGGNTVSLVAGDAQQMFASLVTYPGVGRHFLSWNEYSQATGTTTWGGNTGATASSGIYGIVMG